MYHIPAGALVVPSSLSDLHNVLNTTGLIPVAAQQLPTLSARARSGSTTVVLGSHAEVAVAIETWADRPVVSFGERHFDTDFTIPTGEPFGLLTPTQAPQGARPVVIGDVHNCHRTLTALLASLGVEPGAPTASDPLLVFVGDLVDKGGSDPLDALTTLRLVHRLVHHGQAVVVRGNHEQMILRRMIGTSPEAPSSQASITALRTASDADGLFRWLGALPLAFRLPSVDGTEFTVVHATSTTHAFAQGFKARKLAEQSCLFGRTTTAPLPGVSIHGHWETDEVSCTQHGPRLVVNVDTGAYTGNKLSAFEATSIPEPGTVPSVSVPTELADLPA